MWILTSQDDGHTSVCSYVTCPAQTSSSGQWLLTHCSLEDMTTILKNNFKYISVSDILGISSQIALKWMPKELIDDKSSMVQVIAWCCQAESPYLNSGGVVDRFMMPYGDTRGHWVNSSKPSNTYMC